MASKISNVNINSNIDLARNDQVQPVIGIALCLLTAFITEVALSLESQSSFGYIPALGRICIVFLSLYTIHRFSLISLSNYRPRGKDFFYVHLILILSIILVAFGRFLSVAISTYTYSLSEFFPINATSIHFAIPYAVGAFVIQAVLGMHHGLIFSLSLSLILGIYIPNEFLLVSGVLLSCLVACLSLTRFRTRSAYIKAGLNVALIMLPFALASFVINPTDSLTDIFIRLFSTLVGGILCSFIAAGITPIIEHIGGYVTDMRMIEMATLDHPLLKELSIQAAGTWNHSMVMGMMVEAAADEIGANSVLARVGAYFHDIGKMKKAMYFVENQGGAENRHDKLSPSMSALIIRSHVKDGIELAKKHKLPKAIVDMIPQHHGTSLIEYFYQKACKEMQDAGEEQEVDKSLYSYPGPKPQTKEAGLLMLADGIEAAARTVPEPTHDRIQGLVQKMINKVFASGQLNECELTLKDLNLIARCYTHVLSGIYHQRVAYAEPAEKQSEKNTEKSEKSEKKTKKKTESKIEVKNADDIQLKDEKVNPNKVKAEEEKKKTKDAEDLKRLGM
jgi:hypothetical protein